ncbi:MAG: hypothetical protein K2W95_36335 [Candidatus Obscuribacterales bacterium]|nr:hypothetical protein [Candidatus Obscuribacterales bacterium]
MPTVEYRYDQLGRLVGIDYENCASTNIQYDELGNRTSVVDLPSCHQKFSIVSKNTNFVADGHSGTYYRISGGSVTVTLPESTGDGTVLKFKVMSGTAELVCSGEGDVINHANGLASPSVTLRSRSGVLELISTPSPSAGWDET